MSNKHWVSDLWMLGISYLTIDKYRLDFVSVFGDFLEWHLLVLFGFGGKSWSFRVMFLNLFELNNFKEAYIYTKIQGINNKNFY